MPESLEQLEALAKTLYTGEKFRDAEINNIRAVIAGLVLEAQIVKERLQELQDNPEYAGKHEIHKTEL